MEFLLQQQWYDPRLRYANQSSYEFLNAIHHHEDIWLPDTYFIMHGDFKDPIIPMHFALRIFRNGTINYLMRRHLILSCQGRLNIFPFDDPLCSFALESISYEQSAIRYVWKNDEDTLRKSPSLTTLNAYLIQNQTITCPIKASWRGEFGPFQARFLPLGRTTFCNPYLSLYFFLSLTHTPFFSISYCVYVCLLTPTPPPTNTTTIILTNIAASTFNHSLFPVLAASVFPLNF